MSKYDLKKKADVEKMMSLGMTGAQMAEATGMSAPSVAIWKKKHGLTKTRGGSVARPNKTVRKPITAKGSDAVKQLRGLLDMYENLPGGTDGSQNIRSAIRADMVDLVRSL